MIEHRALNLSKWIKQNRESFKPPVGNKVIWEDAETIVMVVSGPNHRKDYHVNEGEEFFYQIEGDIVLKIIDQGKAVDVAIREGDVYLLRSSVPHSPQRPEHTIGLVIEHKRHGKEVDGFQWYCEKCHHKLHEEFAEIKDIGHQLPQIFDRFYRNKEKRTCKKCGTIMEPPEQDKHHG